MFELSLLDPQPHVLELLLLDPHAGVGTRMAAVARLTTAAVGVGTIIVRSTATGVPTLVARLAAVGVRTLVLILLRRVC